MQALVRRSIEPRLIRALHINPVVFICGPRQAGKSTLVEMIAGGVYPADYVTLDSVTQLAAASASPTAFLTSRDRPLIVDEVQLAPELFRPLKEIVDRRRREMPNTATGRYLLTGSADLMVIPGLSEALVGRMSVLTLFPFSAAEVHGGTGLFLEHLFRCEFTQPPVSDLEATMLAATYPKISRVGQADRAEWMESYVGTILQRDIRSIAEIEKLPLLARLLRILGSRAGGLINDAAIAREAGLNPVTGKFYRTLLKGLFLVFDVPPWHRNIGKRLVKAAKGYLTDTSLLCHVSGRDLSQLRRTAPDIFGHVLENFVATELRKLLSFSDLKAELLHFRTSGNVEVDFILERSDGSVAALEVKSSEHVTGKDFNGIRAFAEAVGKDFVAGVVLYPGSEVVPFGRNLFAVPVSALWG